MTLDKRSDSAGHFELIIDGCISTAYLRNVDGGWMKQQPIDEPTGGTSQRIKHSAVAEIDPFTVDMGLAGSADVMRWIQASWRQDYNRHNGQVSHASFELKRTLEHEFFDALIAETSFPALDKNKGDAAFMKVKIQPERVVTRKKPGAPLEGSTMTSKQKLWSPNQFRLNIDGIDEMVETNKIEQLTIKQGIKKFYTGENRLPQIEPTKIEFPNLVGTISMQFADKLFKWYDEYVHRGQNTHKAQKTGSLEFLGPEQENPKTLFAINLFEVGLLSANVIPSPGNVRDIKRVKFEMYIGRMDIDGTGNLGLE